MRNKFLPFHRLSPNEKFKRTYRQENSPFLAGAKKDSDGETTGERVLSSVVRSQKLQKLDAYYERNQYDHLPEWKEDKAKRGTDTSIRARKPKFNLAFAKTLTSRVTAKIAGQSVFPTVEILENPMDQEFFRTVVKVSRLRAYLVEPIRRTLNTGSCFISFDVVGGRYSIKWYHSKYCYPTFDENDELEQVEIKYVYEDNEDRDAHGKPIKKWFRQIKSKYGETLFDNPVYSKDEKEPVFNVVQEAPNELGFVMGEWMTTSENQGNVDGYSLIEDVLEFIDELNYSLSMSTRAVSYNQDPQLVLKNVSQDETEDLIRSVTNAWNLGREGEAKFLESSLNGVDRAMGLREKMTQNISEITRAIILNPEKMVAVAQSARAMEVLNEPLVELIDEMRSVLEMHIKSLILKMGLAAIYAEQIGAGSPISMPKGYFPQVLDFDLKWPQVFRETLEDVLKRVSIASQAAAGNIISRKTATKYVADIFGVEDIDFEHELIAAQPVFNPFGSF